MKHTNRNTFFSIRLFVLSLAVFMASGTPSLAASCAGISWATPGWPNISYPDYLFGAHERVRANYHSTLNCVGEATKNAITGTYYSKPTHQPNDQFYAAVETTPDVHGNPVFTTSAAQVMDSVNGGTSELLAAGSVGSPYNIVIVHDTLWFDNPGASAGDTEDIPFKLCYKYSTNAPNTTYAAYDDAITTQHTNKFNYQGSSAADTWSWDVSNVINHGNGTTVPWVWDQCNTGKYTMDGLGAGYYSYTTFDADGTQWYDSSKLQWQVDGKLLSCFQITPDPSTGHLPTDVTCHSASGIFPGCEFPIDEKNVCGENRRKEPDQEECNCSKGPTAETGNPINFAYGFKVHTEKDYSGNGALAFMRIYRSNGDWLNFNFGKYWRHNYDRSLQVVDGVTDGSDSALITTSEGTAYLFRTDAGDNNWQALDSDVKATFTELYDSTPTLTGYLYTTEYKTKEYYDTDKKLTRIEYRGGEALDLAYDTSDRLSTVTDEQGRTLTFSYDTSDRVSSVVTPDGTFSYSYDSNNNLTQVTKPDTKTRIYHYEDTNFVNALTGITNEDSVRYATWSYDSAGRAVSSEHAGGVDEFTLTYNSDGTISETNALGLETTYTYTVINGLRKITKIDQAASTNTPAATMSYNYTADGYLEAVTDWEGNVANYAYDANGLETSRTEAVGTSEERTITTTWVPSLRLPDVITETGKTTDYAYDSDGRQTSVTVTDTNTSETRTTTYTYYSNSTGSGGQTILGRLKEIDGPRTDVTDKTTFTYDTSFRLIKTTDALGHYTESTSFDSADRPLVIKDENGVETRMTYDTLGRVATITRAYGTSLAAPTTLTYDDVGNIASIEAPNGVTVTYTYDSANRLTGMEDDLGNTVTYTLDDAGNILSEQRKDPSATLKYTHSQTYDEMSRLLTSVGASSAWSRSYAYDKNSNLTTSTDANSNATTFAYDGLERMISSTDALSGVTENTFNDLDQNTAIEDPRTNMTTYAYNAFGDITQIVSPDTGTATYTHDKAGNVTQKVDARSVVTNYTYDAINRLAAVAFPSDSSLNVTLTYDDNPGTSGACGTSVGRLCRVVDAAGTTDYKYNDLGQLIEVKEVRGSLTFTTAYEYDLAGALTKITLPSGREIDYTLNGNGQIASVSADVNSTATTLASSITYLPSGPMTALTYGNSKTLSATFDQDYRPTNRTVSGVFNHTYATDDDGNITQKGAWTYDYDALNRLDEQDDSSTTTAFTYDAIGNRLTETVGSTTTYTYPSTSSKLSSVGSDSYAYDAMGNITDDDVLAYTWSAAALLGEVKTSGTSTVLGTYTYDADNLRTKKIAGGNTVHYVYGLGGLLYGEYDNSGNLIREYVWLNDEPLAQIDAGSPEVLTYLHTDHLGTPRSGTNAAGSTVWAWDSGAFGKEAATGSATVNLRFPGQYYDSETGLHYNWNRTYNPATGRYVSGDPIGLAGGLNTFGYAGQSPANAGDPEGLRIWDGFVGANNMVQGYGVAACYLSRCTSGSLDSVSLVGFGSAVSIAKSKTGDFIPAGLKSVGVTVVDYEPDTSLKRSGIFGGLFYVTTRALKRSSIGKSRVTSINRPLEVISYEAEGLLFEQGPNTRRDLDDLMDRTCKPHKRSNQPTPPVSKEPRGPKAIVKPMM